MDGTLEKNIWEELKLLEKSIREFEEGKATRLEDFENELKA